MRSILLILLTIFFCLPAFSQEPLKATVTKEWTVDTAREEAFKNVEYTKDLSEYPAIDPNLIENRIAIQNKQEKVGNRRIEYHSGGSYEIRYLEEGYFDKAFTYLANGTLLGIEFFILSKEIKTIDEFIEIENDPNNYPIKGYNYIYPNGKFIGVGIKINKNKSFTFKPNRELNGYCDDNACYYPDGRLKFTYH